MASKLLYLLMVGKHLIVCIKTGQRCNQKPSNTHNCTLDKNNSQRSFRDVNCSRKKIDLRCLAVSRCAD